MIVVFVVLFRPVGATKPAGRTGGGALACRCLIPLVAWINNLYKSRPIMAYFTKSNIFSVLYACISPWLSERDNCFLLFVFRFMIGYYPCRVLISRVLLWVVLSKEKRNKALQAQLFVLVCRASRCVFSPEGKRVSRPEAVSGQAPANGLNLI